MPPLTRPLRCDGERLWRSLMELAEIGRTPLGGCERVALTDADRAGQDRFVAWAGAAGCRIRRDRVGNLFAERPGRDGSRPQVLVGSHLDTQPNGGRFDGAFGVLAALEIVRTLNDHGVSTAAPLVAVSWSNEEGARFPQPTTGAAVFAGALTLEQALEQRASDGRTFGEELARLGLAGEEEVGARPVAAYFEGHIEQGPRLEASGSVIGVVRQGQALRAVSAVLTGRESHAGTTPMDMRRDALLGAARVVELANRVAADFAGALLTVGQLVVEPNSRATVPGRVELVIDVRHPDGAVADAAEAAVRRGVERIAADGGLEVSLSRFLEMEAVVFDEGCNRLVRDAAEALGHPWLEVESGAGHDAMRIARIAPSALVFVPSHGGVSHNPEEYTAPEHVAAGCDVLLHAALATAGVVQATCPD